MPLELVLWSALAFFACFVAAIAACGRRNAHCWIYGACFIVCVAAFVAGARALIAGGAPELVLPIGLPWLGAHFRLDPLAAFFLCVVNFGGAAASFYGVGYGAHETQPQRVLPFFPAFLAGMNLVVVAGDAFSFLISWEFMSLTSWALVVSHDRAPENLRAGYVYILMASLGTMALLLGFGILAGPAGNYAFEAMRAHALAGWQLWAVLLLVLIGTGSKAGVIPLHAWLPLAHPAAPSHVSALMSGVMTKVAVYAFIRIVFDLLRPVDWHYSMLVILVGGITAVLGVLYALMEHDLKRLLAYHTVENIGLIFVGLGLALAFRSAGLAGAAALALTGALFHVFNHSVFKSLLFFGAGAVQGATGERDMEHLGGLIHAMPKTALAFLIGAAAISALPPLNGFASEWLIFQATFLSTELPQWGLKFLAPATAAMLALAAGLAAACFVKAFGITFLGRPRSDAARQAREVDGVSIAAMAALALVCILAGAFSGYCTNVVGKVTAAIAGAQLPAQAWAAPWQALVPVAGSTNTYSGLEVLLCVILAAVLTAGFVRAFANLSTRRGPAWDCGFPNPSPTTQYTAASFAQPIRRVFATSVFAAREHVEMAPPGDTGPSRFRVTLHDPIWEKLYLPVAAAIGEISSRFNRFQSLTIRRYLSLVFATLVLLLFVLALWP